MHQQCIDTEVTSFLVTKDSATMNMETQEVFSMLCVKRHSRLDTQVWRAGHFPSDSEPLSKMPAPQVIKKTEIKRKRKGVEFSVFALHI